MLTGHADPVCGVAVTPDGRIAVSGGADGTVRVWDLAGTAPPRVLTGHHSQVSGVAVTPDGRTAVSGGTVRLWDLAGTAPPRVLTGDADPVWGVAVSADGRTAVSGGHDGTVRVWDLAGTAPPRAHRPRRPGGRGGGHCGRADRGQRRPRRHGMGVAVSADGRTAVSGGHDGTERDFLHASKRAAAHSRHLRWGAVAVAMLALVASTAFVLATLQRTIAVRQAAQAIYNQTIAEALQLGASDTPLTAQLNLAAYYMPSTSDFTPKSGLISRLLSTESTPLSSPLADHAGAVDSVALSRDGRTLASGHGDGTVRLWNVADPAHPQALGKPLTGGTGPVYTVALSRDGRTLATGDGDACGHPK